MLSTDNGAPAGSGARTAWLFLRASGVALFVFALVHLALMHYVNAPAQTDAAFVVRRWAKSVWVAFDATLLVLALTHGLTGLQTIVRDALQTRSRATRRAADALIAATALTFVVLGVVALVAGAAVSHAGTATRNGGPFWIADVLHGALVAIATVTYAALVAIVLAVALRCAAREPLQWWSFAGHWAWALHRASGLGILGFLLVHVVDVALLPFAPAVYDRTVASYAEPYLVPMEIVLVAAVVYHALNGLRLVVFEALDRRGVRFGAMSLAAVLGLTVALVLPSVAVLVRAGR
ncbi:MAG: hypothetical protein NVS3B16_18430 [Vulcanimicrobiaceae bacterium]